MKFKEFYSKKNNISPQLEKILKENIFKAIECSYKSVLSEGRWAPKGGGSEHATIDSWSAEIDLDDEEIKDALTGAVSGKEELVDKMLKTPDKAIDKLVALLNQAEKDGDETKTNTYAIALKSILMLSDTEKAEEVAKKEKDKLEKVEVTPEATKEAPKEEETAKKAEELEKATIETKKEVEAVEVKKAESPEEKKTEATLDDLIGRWNKELTNIEKKKNTGEALVEIQRIYDKIIEVNKKFIGVDSMAVIALLDRMTKITNKLKTSPTEAIASDKKPAEASKPEEVKPEKKPASPTPEEEAEDAKLESFENSSDKELLNESIFDLFTSFFGSDKAQKAIAAEELIDQHQNDMAQMLLNFYIKNPKTLLVVFESLGSISDLKLKKKMAEYMYYMFLMHQGKEKKWFKKDATDLLNKYSSDTEIAAGIAKAKSELTRLKITP